MRLTTAISALLTASIAIPAAAVSVQNPTDLFTAATLVNPTTQYTGVVGVQTQTNAQFAAGMASVCSGAVIGNMTVLTAAHCVADDGSGIRSTRIFLPQFIDPSDIITASRDIIAPGYIGNTASGSDLAIVKLSKPVPQGTQIYAIDTGSVASDLGVEAMVGLGTLGTGASGDSGYQDGYKRIGYNQYETTFDEVLAAAGFSTPADDAVDIFGAPKGSQLAYDFDDGTAAHDVFGRYLGLSGLGYTSPDGVYHDTLSTSGDSGAPHFENGKIVGVTSFGVSGALFEGGTCGLGTSVDPSATGGDCTNSSFGEIGVDTRVAAFQTFITSNIPEPSTWSLMIGGLGLVGGSFRRRRKAAFWSAQSSV